MKTKCNIANESHPLEVSWRAPFTGGQGDKNVLTEKKVNELHAPNKVAPFPPNHKLRAISAL